LQGIEHSQNVIGQALIVVSGRGVARLAVAASSHAVDMAAVAQLGREVIEDVRGIAASGEQNDGTARAAPVEHLKLYIVIDGDELHLVLRRVAPRIWFLSARLRRRERLHDHDADRYENARDKWCWPSHLYCSRSD